MIIQQSTAQTLSFLMVSTSDGRTPISGQASNIQVVLSKNGASFANASGTVYEVGNGWYRVTLTTTESNTVGQLIFRAYDKKSTATMFDWADIHEVKYSFYATLTSAEMNSMADHVLRREWGNAEASSNGDTVSFRSILGVIAKTTNKTKSSTDGTKLEIYEDDDSTIFAQQAFLTGAGPSATVTGLDTV